MPPSLAVSLGRRVFPGGPSQTLHRAALQSGALWPQGLLAALSHTPSGAAQALSRWPAYTRPVPMAKGAMHAPSRHPCIPRLLFTVERFDRSAGLPILDQVEVVNTTASVRPNSGCFCSAMWRRSRLPSIFNAMGFVGAGTGLVVRSWEGWKSALATMLTLDHHRHAACNTLSADALLSGSDTHNKNTHRCRAHAYNGPDA